ncbi:MAG TPA: hemerythrin domain-containing protein [Blastocatellia bacterium]
MSRPTHILRHEHRVIEQGLRALDGMCLSLKTGGDVPPEPLYQMLDFIRNFADRFHHNKEEAYLFPALGKHALRNDSEAIRFLMEEHQTERALIAELEQAVGEYSRGNPAAANRIIQAANQYCDHLVGHMRDEEAILFRLAEEVLDEQVKALLIKSFAQKDAEGDDGTAARYEQLADELEKNWAV